MKVLSLSLCAALMATCASADLIKEAKEAGLMPIPKSSQALEKLIKEHAGDYDKYPTTKARVELGKKLYFDPRISKSGIISCNTCHNLSLGGVDGLQTSYGHKWAANPHHVNAPTVLNSVFNDIQFWDGRAAHLQDQAKGPIQANPEMAADPNVVVKKITSIPEYVAEFQQAYGKNVKIDFDLIAASIGIFERTLVTPSRFDAFLQGDKKALSATEQEGLKLFIDKGCTGCHTGINIGGSLQNFEVAGEYKYKNVGDFKGNKDGQVRTPTLRNIALTGPYYHNGAVATLKEAVQQMGKIQLGIDINDKDADLIVTFLKSLTGKQPQVQYPILPPSTDATPKPVLD